MGFREALAAWKPLLAEKGYMAITHLCWLRDKPPEEIRRFWAENFPAMASVEDNLRIIGETGYEEIGHFTLPTAAWWNDYYDPLEKNLVRLRQKYANDAEALKWIAASQSEIDMYRKYSNYYGYVFFVMRKCS